MKREMNPAMKDVLKLKEEMKSGNNGLKDGVPLTIMAWDLYKSNNRDLEKAIKEYKDDKSGYAKKLDEITKQRQKK